MLRNLVAILLFSTLLGQSAYAANSAIDELNGIRTEMLGARTNSDWRVYLDAAKRQSELLNESPMSRVEIARAQAHLEDMPAAFDALNDFVSMGQSHELLETLADFAALRSKPEFAAIRTKSLENQKPIARSSVAFRLQDRGLLPEDIDYDPRGKRFLISSVLQNKIVSVAPDGKTTDFALSPDGWPVFALKIDHSRQLLWASEVAMQGFASVDEAARGRSAILCYELRTGKLLRRIEAPRASKLIQVALGDIVVAADGSVIASDGEGGGIYRLQPGGAEMVRIDAGDFISPQTPVMSKDREHLIVPDYLRGVGVLSLKTKQVTWLSSQRRYAFNGIDGLYGHGRKLIAVQNGTMPPRVAMFSLDTSGMKTIAQEIIERSTNTLGDPTHGVIVGNTFYYLANSGWDVLEPSGKVKAGLTQPESVVMKFELLEPSP